VSLKGRVIARILHLGERGGLWNDLKAVLMMKLDS
jgi:hypothetical protein